MYSVHPLSKQSRNGVSVRVKLGVNLSLQGLHSMLFLNCLHRPTKSLLENAQLTPLNCASRTRRDLTGRAHYNNRKILTFGRFPTSWLKRSGNPARGAVGSFKSSVLSGLKDTKGPNPRLTHKESHKSQVSIRPLFFHILITANHQSGHFDGVPYLRNSSNCCSLLRSRRC